MGFKCFVEGHVQKGMMVQMFQDGILKLNHLLFDELFKWRKTRIGWDGRKSYVALKCF
jgi:hypothetical protein